ncbi:MAG: TonB-dependent receptor [Gammaproteobacteria bacterium]|nr:TonB-dependent receptor [Gammaproteobacteria bacterium]
MYRHGSGVFLGPTFDLIGKRWADFANTYKVDSYGLLGWRGGFDGSNWRVFVEVQNLLDENYIATHGVRDTAAPNAAILNPGTPRSIYAGVTLAM